MDTARRSKRYPSDRPLLVRCDSWLDFVELYAADIGQGGMFIVTNEPPPILSVIDIRMQLPEAMEIPLRARVVHVVEKEQAAENKPAGVGVEFVDLDPERKRQIFHLLEFARWQGATGDPNASLQRTMAELSRSRPPQQIGDVLPVKSEGSVSKNPRKITLDGTEKHVRPGDPASASKNPRKITLDGTEKAVRAGDSKNPRKITLDGTDKAVRAPAAAASRPPGEPAKATDAKATDAKATDAKPAGPPADPALLKSIMTHFAHKRYDVALKEAAGILASNPNEAQALKWQALCKARQAIAAKNEAEAAQHYEKALTHDESLREARDFVRNFHRDKRLNALPFGRYFMKKK